MLPQRASVMSSTRRTDALARDIPGSGGEVAAVVAAAVALVLFIALVPGCQGQLLRFGLQQLAEGFLCTASHRLLELAFDNFRI